MKPTIDPVLAASYLGKHLLIGMTYTDENNNVLEQKQLHGIISRINSEEGIVVSLPTSKEFKLPPDLRGFESAPLGEYKLLSTGEIVVDPDYISNWTVTKEDSDES